MENELGRRFYVYVHRRLDGQIFYVGKGSDGRWKSRKGRNQYWRRVAAKGFVPEIAISCLQEVCAFCIEKIMIHAVGKETLCNMTDGGEGASGWIPSVEFKRSLSERMKGRPLSPNARTPEAKEKRRQKLLGRKHTKAHREKIGLAQRGKYSGGKIFHFYHPVHGEKKTTASLLMREYNLDRNISGVASGRCKSSNGWCLYENKDRTGYPLRERHHMADKSQHIFVHEKYGKFIGTRYDLSEKHGLSLQGIGKIVRGDKPSYKGWRIE